MTRLVWLLSAFAMLAALLAAGVWALNVRDEPDLGEPDAAAPFSPAQIERGAYLARAGNCVHCHTTRGGATLSGGRGIETPFGTLYSSNLTPDAVTGLGRWSRAEFYRALHNGRAKDGRLLYPAFPYPDFTVITRDDSDALLGYLMSLPPARQPNRPHALRWPFDTQAALAVWRALYFRPASFEPDAARSAEWNRGAYLARGLAHCAACHSARDALGGITDRAALDGGTMPMQGWYAPSLVRKSEASVADWSLQDIARLLTTGVSPRGVAIGPMAEVVRHGTQYLNQADANALATWLKALPPSDNTAAVSVAGPANAVGAKLYDKHCAQCHGDEGRGQEASGLNGYGAYPPLAGNRAVTMGPIDNLVQIVRYGGFAPATAGNSRPFGMPPFLLTLDDAEIAAVLSHIRASWGNAAQGVTELDVRNIPSATTD